MSLLTLGDATLTTADLSLLVPPCWLNDALLTFWLEHLRLHVLPPQARANVALVPPNLSFFLSASPDDSDARAVATEAALPAARLALLPLNDAAGLPAFVAPAGTHWSLLVYDRPAETFYHLDSLPSPEGRARADALAARLRDLLRLPAGECVEMRVSHQRNGYDCGAYLCIFAEDVVRNFLRGREVATVYEAGSGPAPEEVEKKRQEIGKLVCRLVDERQRGDGGGSDAAARS